MGARLHPLLLGVELLHLLIAKEHLFPLPVQVLQVIVQDGGTVLAPLLGSLVLGCLALVALRPVPARSTLVAWRIACAEACSAALPALVPRLAPAVGRCARAIPCARGNT